MLSAADRWRKNLQLSWESWGLSYRRAQLIVRLLENHYIYMVSLFGKNDQNLYLQYVYYLSISLKFIVLVWCSEIKHM